MIQKCPECGKWCTTDGENMLERGVLGVFRNVNEMGEVGEKYLGKLGKRAGQLVGGYTSMYRGLNDALFGYKYQFECQCGHCWGTDDEEEDETEYYEHECYVSELCDKLLEVDPDDDNEWKSCFDELQEARDSEYNTAITQSLICDATATLFIFGSLRIEDNEKFLEHALTEINTSLKLFDDENSHITRGVIFALSNNYSYYSALRELIYSKEKESHPYISMEFIQDKYNEMCEGYEKNFLEIPKEQRKYLALVDDYNVITDNFLVLRSSGIPNNLKFLGDNILENTLYVIHPLKDDTYIPIDDYAIELFREQLLEYRYIMECLGAKSFSIKDLHSNNTENSQDSRYKVGVGGEYQGYSARGSYESSEKTEQYRRLYNELSQEIRCELSEKPYIPEDTLWYKHKSDWHRNCDSRIAGRMLVFKQNVSNRISSGLTKQEAMKIEGEFNATIFKINGEYENENKFTIKEDHEHIWEIIVEFYPMGEYNKTESKQAQSSLLSSNEEKYIAAVKAYLEEDGVISPKERKLLETLGESLGISSTRANELESLFIVQKSQKKQWWKLW